MNAKISPSKRQAREDITNGAISINGDKVTDLSPCIVAEDRIEEQFTAHPPWEEEIYVIEYIYRNKNPGVIVT